MSTIVDFVPTKTGTPSLRDLGGKVVLISATAASSTLTKDGKPVGYFVTAITEGNGMLIPAEFSAPKHVALACAKVIAENGDGAVVRALVETPGKRGCHLMAPPAVAETNEDTGSDDE